MPTNRSASSVPYTLHIMQPRHYGEVCPFTRKAIYMNRTSSYPFNSTTPLPALPGQGADQFAPFSPEKLFTVQEAASFLRVEPRTIGKFITDGNRLNKLKASWIGRRWIITAASLREFVDAQVSQ